MSSNPVPVANTDTLREQAQDKALAPLKGGQTLQEKLSAMLPEISLAFPKTLAIDEKRFMRVLQTMFRSTNKLNLCTEASVFGAVMVVAQLGLDFDLDEAYLVPFKKNWKDENDNWHSTLECQLIIGYKGYIALAMRSGLLKDIVAREVYEGDLFELWEDEAGDHLKRIPCRTEEKRGEIVGYYGRVLYKSGGVHITYMSLGDIDNRRKRSAASQSGKKNPWETDKIAMSCKTVLRKMRPYLPLAAELGGARVAPVGDDAIIHRMGTGELKVEHPSAIDVESTMTSPSSVPESQSSDVTPKDTSKKESETESPIKAQKASSKPKSPEPRTEQEPLPNEPPDLTDAPPAANGVSSGDVPQELVDATMSAIEKWSAETLTRILKEWQQPTTGSLKSKQMRAFQLLTPLRHAGTEAANALF